MTCAEIQEMLPSLVEDRGATLTTRRHLSRCPECRAELARYEELRASLGALTTVAAEPPASLLGALVAIPTGGSRIDQARTHLERNRRVYVGGFAVALAGAAGAAVWRSRRTRLAPA